MPYSAKGRRKKSESDESAVKSLLLVSDSQIWLDALKKPYSHYEIAMHLSQSISDGFIVQKPDRLLKRALTRNQNAKLLTNTLHIKQYKAQSCRTEKELFSWMKKFNGVASKYLQDYWTWFLLENRILKFNAFVAEFNRACVYARCLDQYVAIKKR